LPESPEIRPLPLDAIDEPPRPLRETIDRAALGELADDIARRGLLQPIGVRPIYGTSRYQIIYGHRRYLAVQLLGWATIPALIRQGRGDGTDEQLAENLHREALTPTEEARTLGKLLAEGKTLPDLLHITRKSESWVRARLKVLEYPADLQAAIHAHGLPLAVAGLLEAVDHADYRAYLTREVIEKGATTRTVAAWVQHYQTERDYIHRNEAVVADIVTRRDAYRVLVPCEYCGEEEVLDQTRLWRLCGRCTTALAGAKGEIAAPQEIAAPGGA